MKNKVVASFLALFFGCLGLHWFYLERTKRGLIYLLFCWTIIPFFISLYDAIKLMTMSFTEFNSKYNNNRDLINIQIAEIPPPNIELDTLQKLQFKKYLSEESGMDLMQVEDYLVSLEETEREVLEKKFIVHAKAVNIPTPTSVDKQFVVQDNKNQLRCPKCRSVNITYNKKGFSVGKAFGGAVLTGGIGLLAGGIGKNKILLTCLNCGKTWKKG